MPVLLKVVISGLIVGAVNLVAQRSPALAGWLAAFPLVTFLSVVWLSADGRDSATLADLVTGAFWGMVPTALMLAVLLLSFRFGLHALAAIGFAMLVWAAVTFAARTAGLFA